jgi:hypothetical protein
LRKSRRFAVVAVVTLALAIGANAVVFSVINAMLLRPLNLPNEQSLYLLERGNDKDPAQSYPDYLDLRDRNRTFADLAALTSIRCGWTPASILPAPGSIESAETISTYWGYSRTLGDSCTLPTNMARAALRISC